MTGSTLPPDNEGGHTSAVTPGVSLLTGDPKTAILTLSSHMIVAMLLLSVYNVVDAIWVAGLGADALAAVGFMTPLFMILIGLGTGLGSGVTSAISRRIGAGNKPGADSTAMHALLLTAVISAVITPPLALLTGAIAVLLGAGDVAGLAAEYGSALFSGTVFILFTNISYAILRAEGDTKRTMYALGASSVINMVLDPILIYWAGWGISGAAWATVISVAAVSVVIAYWFLVRKDTYVSFSLRSFSPERETVSDILTVGLPASLEFFLMSFLAMVINVVLVMIAGTDAVAVYTTGWRVVIFAVIPQIAIGTSVVSVVGAAYGARLYKNLRSAYGFSLRLGTAIALCTSILTWILAPNIAAAFTYSGASAHIGPSLVAFLRTMCLFFLFVSPGIMSGSVFQGAGRGIISLAINLLRNLVFIAVLVWVFACVLGWGEQGVWWGIVGGNILGGIVGHIWVRLFIKRLIAVSDGRETPPRPGGMP